MQHVVLLIRHAQADAPHDRLAGRRSGVHLSERGREQAQALARRLEAVRLGAVYSSPLERCRETAEAVARGRRTAVRVDEGVGEVDFGRWQGRTYTSLRRTKLWGRVQHVPSQAVFPEGESVRALQGRGVEAVERIRAAHRRGVVAVVSHADTIKAITAHYLGLHLDLFQRLVVPTASVTAVGFGDEFPRVLRMGDTGSYDELVALTRRRRRR